MTDSEDTKPMKVPRYVVCNPQPPADSPLQDSEYTDSEATYVGVRYGEADHEVVRMYIESDGRITLDTLAAHIDLSPAIRRWSVGSTAVFDVHAYGEDQSEFLKRWGDL